MTGFKLNLARFEIGLIPPPELPKLALDAMEEGYSFPSLLILAGKDKHENPFLTRYYFDQALLELGVQLPGDKGKSRC